MGIEVEHFCELTIATPPQFERLKPGIEAPPLFVEQAVERQDRSLEFIHRDLQAASVDHKGQCFDRAPGTELRLLSRAIYGGVKVPSGGDFWDERSPDRRTP
jgi:hypothetical protein